MQSIGIRIVGSYIGIQQSVVIGVEIIICCNWWQTTDRPNRTAASGRTSIGIRDSYRIGQRIQIVKPLCCSSSVPQIGIRCNTTGNNGKSRSIYTDTILGIGSDRNT